MQQYILNLTYIGGEMPRSIMEMDWRALGYWPVYRDGKLKWEKDPDKDDN